MVRNLYLGLLVLGITTASAADCILWVGGAKEYVAGDCVTLEGNTYYAQRPVNAWTHPYDTWHWSTVPPSGPVSPSPGGSVVLDPLAVYVTRPIVIPSCPGSATFPLSEQSYTVQKDGLLAVESSLLVAQLSAGEGTYHIDIVQNGVSHGSKFHFMVEAYYMGGHYREANARNQLEVHAGDEITVKTSVYNVWVNIGQYCTGHTSTIEHANVYFYEGGKLLSSTTALQRK